MKKNEYPEDFSGEKRRKTSDWKEKLGQIHKKEVNNSARSGKPAPAAEKTDENVLEEQQDVSELEFHLEQTKKRSQIRIEQGRPTYFDKLLQVSMIFSNEISIPLEEAPAELQEPYLYLENIKFAELENVKSAILLQLKLEKSRSLQNYWENLLSICEDKLYNSSSIFAEDIKKILTGKNASELISLRSQILQNFDNPTLDKKYWQEVLSSISVYKSKIELKSQYQEFLESIEKNPVKNSLCANNLSIKKIFSFKAEPGKTNFGDGSNSPLLVPIDCASDFELLTADEDISLTLISRKETLAKELELLKLSQSRLSITTSPLLEFDNKLLDISANDKIMSGNLNQSIDEMMKLEILKKMPVDADENEFSELVNIKPVMEEWMQKYKPRKPKFFNRIKTGYEWNRHNQTHYDHKNPPPKVVQGYKFNVFYPFLIDRTKAPQFYLEPNENHETCTIRFHAGPPYEDIAFKIVNREWDFSDRNGFKCFFDKGVLHLYFNFKRHRYKR